MVIELATSSQATSHCRRGRNARRTGTFRPRGEGMQESRANETWAGAQSQSDNGERVTVRDNAAGYSTCFPRPEWTHDSYIRLPFTVSALLAHSFLALRSIHRSATPILDLPSIRSRSRLSSASLSFFNVSFSSMLPLCCPPLRICHRRMSDGLGSQASSATQATKTGQGIPPQSPPGVMGRIVVHLAFSSPSRQARPTPQRPTTRPSSLLPSTYEERVLPTYPIQPRISPP
ncbi:hypothetical protein NMY22_g14861 [Coprinellus aureogranulatus]|nr:hypothetical protein NMY22_g14861 [Coprinellus aureogranulatus]